MIRLSVEYRQESKITIRLKILSRGHPYRSARTSFIGKRSFAGADVQPGGQVEKRFAGDARCKKKKKGYSNLEIENRMPTRGGRYGKNIILRFFFKYYYFTMVPCQVGLSSTVKPMSLL